MRYLDMNKGDMNKGDMNKCDPPGVLLLVLGKIELIGHSGQCLHDGPVYL